MKRKMFVQNLLKVLLKLKLEHTFEKLIHIIVYNSGTQILKVRSYEQVAMY